MPIETWNRLNGEKLFYLDVRKPKELEDTGAIKGYVNIPIGQLESRLKEVPKGQTIVVYCQGGRRPARGAEILQKNGSE